MLHCKDIMSIWIEEMIIVINSRDIVSIWVYEDTIDNEMQEEKKCGGSSYFAAFYEVYGQEFPFEDFNTQLNMMDHIHFKLMW